MTDSRTVLQVTAIPLTAAHFLLPLARALRSEGFRVHFACAPGPELATLTTRGFAVHTVPIDRRMSSARNGPALFQLLSLMRRERFDVVHAHTPVAGLLARLAARGAGVPVVLYTLHGSIWNEGLTARSRLFSLAERIGAACTDHVFVLNDSDANELQRRRFYQAGQITNLGVGGSGIDLTRFDPDSLPTDTRARIRSELEIPDDAKVIGYLGRIVREKGVLDLLAAFALLQAQFPHAHLVLAGGTVSGEWDAVGEADMLAALGHDEKLRRRVHITGFRADAPALLAGMDVVALPSWREGFGMALGEAGAMGLPVVGTSTPGGKQAIVHGETGLLVPLRRPDLLAGALAALLQPGVARRLGAAGRLRAQTEFAQSRTIARQLVIYRALLNPLSPMLTPTSQPAAGAAHDCLA